MPSRDTAAVQGRCCCYPGKMPLPPPPRAATSWVIAAAGEREELGHRVRNEEQPYERYSCSVDHAHHVFVGLPDRAALSWRPVPGPIALPHAAHDARSQRQGTEQEEAPSRNGARRSAYSLALEVAIERWNVVSKVLIIVDALKEDEHVTPPKGLETLPPHLRLTKPYKVVHFVSCGPTSRHRPRHSSRRRHAC
ncbi:hypothetical protein ABZP36_005159 [Zizania latifolia]